MQAHPVVLDVQPQNTSKLPDHNARAKCKVHGETDFKTPEALANFTPGQLSNTVAGSWAWVDHSARSRIGFRAAKSERPFRRHCKLSRMGAVPMKDGGSGRYNNPKTVPKSNFDRLCHPLLYVMPSRFRQTLLL